MPVGWLAIRVDLPSEMNYLAALLTARPELKGMHVFGADVEQLWDWFRADYRFVQAAGGAVTDERGRLLAIHRMGRWDLPKGKVEKGEPIDAAAVRAALAGIVGDHARKIWQAAACGKNAACTTSN